MTKEQYNSLAPYQKEMYDKCNRGNKGALIAGWIFGAIVAVASLIMMISGAVTSGASSGFGDVMGGIFGALLIGIIFGGIFPGIAHLGFLFKKIKLDTAILLILLIGVFILMIYAIILAVIMYTGWIFLIIDTILFIMKKPLIYKLEDKRVLAKAETQPGAYQVSPSTTDKLNELEGMLNSGTITQEEFSKKKAELLERM